MRLLGLFLLFICITAAGSGTCYAQQRATPRYGMVVLTTDDTLYGTFTIDLADNLLEVHIGNTIRTFSARQVQHFTYKEEEDEKREHIFVSLPYNERSNYKVPTFFDMLYGGKRLSLLVRESYVTVSLPQYDSFTNRSFNRTQTRLVQDFFFLTEAGLVKRYGNRRKDLYALFPEHEAHIKQYMEQNNLGYTSREDLFKITEYCNTFPKIEKPGQPDEK